MHDLNLVDREPPALHVTGSSKDALPEQPPALALIALFRERFQEKYQFTCERRVEHGAT